MKKLISVLLILTVLGTAYASADAAFQAGIYNSYAEMIFDLPKVDIDLSYTTEDAFTGGVITLWSDDNVMIGFIESKDGDLTGAFCADLVNNDAEFLVRCACVLFAFEMWDETMYQPLFDAYIHARKMAQAYAVDLNDNDRLIMGKSDSGFMMYIVQKE